MAVCKDTGMNNISRRRGIINITLDLIRDNPKQIIEVFALIGFTPIRTNYDYRMDVVEYQGICQSFDELEMGCVIPTYYLTCYWEIYLGITGATVEKVDARLAMELTFKEVK